MSELVFRDEDGPVAVYLYTTPARHVVWLDWSSDPGDDAAPALRRAIGWAFTAGYRRVESAVPVTDPQALAAATTVGLRREGISRAGTNVAGEDNDLVRLARLATDVDPEQDLFPTIAASFNQMMVASGALVRSTDGRVLLLETSYKPDWEIPGGLCEPGEHPEQTLARECQEEIGLLLPFGELLVVDFTSANERRGDMLALVYDGGIHDPELLQGLEFRDGEIIRAHWVATDDIQRHASPILSNRLLQALRAAGR